MVTDAEVVVQEVGPDVAPEVGPGAAVVNTRGTDSNTGIDIQMDSFDR